MGRLGYSLNLEYRDAALFCLIRQKMNQSAIFMCFSCQRFAWTTHGEITRATVQVKINNSSLHMPVLNDDEVVQYVCTMQKGQRTRDRRETIKTTLIVTTIVAKLLAVTECSLPINGSIIPTSTIHETMQRLCAYRFSLLTLLGVQALGSSM